MLFLVLRPIGSYHSTSIDWSEGIRPLKYTSILNHVIKLHEDTVKNMRCKSILLDETS